MNDRTQDPSAIRLVQAYALLGAVRAHGGFAPAARALGLDPSAISHRIRALEAELGMTLFDRSTRRIAPTRAGAILTEAAARAVEEASRALSAARDLRGSRTIRLSASSSLAMKWLLPRLTDAAAAGLDLSLDVRETLAGFEGGALDAGLRFGPGPYPGLHATRLCVCALQPVIGAAHPAARSPAGDPLAADLVRLIDEGAERSGAGATWAEYGRLRDGSAPTARAAVEMRFDRADLALQAAIGGLGLALGRTLLIEDDIRRGLLIPLGPPARMRSAYWLVARPEQAESESMIALRAWLREQIRLTGV